VHHRVNLVYNTLMQPGETINPGGQTTPPPLPDPVNVPPQPAPQPPAPTQPSPSEYIEPAQPIEPIQQPAPVFAAPTAPEPQANTDPQSLTWTASEFINHHKDASWYGVLGLGVVVACVVVYLLTHDKISIVAILVAGGTMAVFAGHKPRTLTYTLGQGGITIGSKTYPFSVFKSFSVIDEDAINSVSLLPLKRFMPSITIYYEPADEDNILGILSDYLPYEDRQGDAVDKIMRKIRF
jgi:hypothetical protein